MCVCASACFYVVLRMALVLWPPCLPFNRSGVVAVVMKVVIGMVVGVLVMVVAVALAASAAGLAAAHTARPP